MTLNSNTFGKHSAIRTNYVLLVKITKRCYFALSKDEMICKLAQHVVKVN